MLQSLHCKLLKAHKRQIPNRNANTTIGIQCGLIIDICNNENIQSNI